MLQTILQPLFQSTVENMHQLNRRIGKLKFILLFSFLYCMFIFLFYTPFTPAGKWVFKDFPGNVTVLDLHKKGYTPDQVFNTLTLFGEKGRQSYFRNLLLLDIVYPILYALFFGSIIAFLLLKIGPKQKVFFLLTLLPFAGLLFDYFENVVIMVLLKSYPQPAVVLAVVANIFTRTKWAVINSSSLTILVLLVWLVIALIIRRFMKKKVEKA